MNRFFFKWSLLKWSLGIVLAGTNLYGMLLQPATAKQEQTLALRAIQSRSFETTDQTRLIQTITSTLQDMGYIIIRTDTKTGFVTATHFADDIIEITVTVQPIKNAIIVRASARKDNLPMEKEATYYQAFFNHLSQALFLNANQIY